ncbi:hypothetical protein CCMSSC00406_0003291 [Pleurotus cornucopiae]|uniref:Uncharacterized protein n=1 Tax=Pleurotus cornucopiae TaxID=5321 RepID=A0ACB7J7C5_PLECO|nr:hypothetical protein CCMSSC00406_0003291 [Pleurotus cornucopiae]
MELRLSLPVVRKGVACCSIIVNALFAGGIFIFPIISPALVSHLKLTQPQLTTIVLAGMVGQYPFSVLVGYMIDYYGPAACSLVASVMFSAAFSCFSHEISIAPDDISVSSSATFYKLTLYFFVAGLGTVFSYFSLLFSAAQCFPNHPGIASGLSTAVFGLSPLFLSLLASNLFTTASGLQVIPFLRFLAICTGVVHLCGFVTLRIPKPTPLPPAQPSEHTPLLQSASGESGTQQQPRDDSLLGLLSDRFFWILFLACVLTLGYCEMIISNIGTIVLSLSKSTVHSQESMEAIASQQVRLISFSNTASRIVVGPLADFISPVASHLPSGLRALPSHHFISRVAFISVPTALLVISSLVMIFTIDEPQKIWILSAGIGMSYGTIFTLLPSILSAIWGVPSLGRNFGALTYAPFIGTPIFSYLYAFVSAKQSVGGGLCIGTSCWIPTFWTSFVSLSVALLATLYLWKAWKGHL